MKKLIAGLLVGLVLGAAGAWFALREQEHGAEHAERDAEAAKPAANPLQLTAEKRTAAGIVLGEPKRVELAPEVKAYGRVLDPSPLIALLADIESARAALAASEKEFARVQKLHAQDANVSAQVVETAEATVLRDRAQATAAQARLIAAWGAALARRSDLPQLIAAFAEQKMALVRIDLLGVPASADLPREARVAALMGDETPRPAEIIAPAPAADAASQAPGYLALVRENPRPPGTALVAWLTGNGAAQPALMVPPGAIVYHNGSAWVFVLGKNDTFERRRVEIARTSADGVAVVSGLDEHARIAIGGTQQLLSVDLQSATKD
jgi:hypothetical protein